MTNHEIQNLKVGDRIRGIQGDTDTTVTRVRVIGRCIDGRSGAYGHAFACIETRSDTGLRLVFSVRSDEYLTGEGYPVFHSGQRIRGWELASRR